MRVKAGVCSWLVFVAMGFAGCSSRSPGPPVVVGASAPAALPLEKSPALPAPAGPAVRQPLARAAALPGKDSDGDGVSDATEAEEGTNPLDDKSVRWKPLASFRFDQGSLRGDQGQEPLVVSNVVFGSGFEGQGADFNPVNGRPVLQFRGFEHDGSGNISLKRGAVRFRFQPHWFGNDPSLQFGNVFASGSGPGNWITIFETARFAIRIDPAGTNLVFTSRNAGGIITTNLQSPIVVRSAEPRRSKSLPGDPYWYDCLVTWSPEQTYCSWSHPDQFIRPPNRYKNFGAGLASADTTNTVFSIGSALDGSGAVNGLLDNIEFFNVPVVLATNSWNLSAVTSENASGLKLLWTGPTNLIAEIRRRAAGSTNWDYIRSALGTSYLDREVIPGERYEYQLNTWLDQLDGGRPDRIGQWITASINARPIEQRGKLILLVDRTLAGPLDPDLRQFTTNLVGDGWEVLRADVPRHVDTYGTAEAFRTNLYNITNVIKPFIISNWNRYHAEIKQILIFGHVSIPYSGIRADDGHTPGAPYGSHEGAWASDLYYGDVDGIWTDSLSKTNSREIENYNWPGDGKFDQDYIPGNSAGAAALEIPVARIDFARLPAFQESEAALLKRYLAKDDAYRRGTLAFPPKVMQADLFYNEISARIVQQTASEISSKLAAVQPPLAGDAFVSPSPLAFGVQSGSGFYDKINDARPQQHSTADYASGRLDPSCAFYLLRGSFFGDWNCNNDFLRATLAGRKGGLAAGWMLWQAAWRFDPLANGLTLGDGVLSVINDRIRGQYAQSARATEIMGDSTLRYPVMPAPAGLALTGARLSWQPARDSAWLVYRSENGISGPFQKVTPAVLHDPAFTDSSPPRGPALYMVRALQLAVTGAGSFTNISQGAFVGK